MFDVIVVGGGPAGLNAALMLGRVRRAVLLVDAGMPRNGMSHALHGFLSRDGEDPEVLRSLARKELEAYPSVQQRNTTATDARVIDGGFEVTLADGSVQQGRRLLLTGGLRDRLPAIDGVAELWGRGVYPCPYCHGWELRDQPLAVIAADDVAARLAVNLIRLDCPVTLVTNGPHDLSDNMLRVLERLGSNVVVDPLTRVQRADQDTIELHFSTGNTLERRAIFLRPVLEQSSLLPQQLDCAVHDDGLVVVNEVGQTSVPGVYAAGELCRTSGVGMPGGQMIIAAGAGARVAVIIDQELLFSDTYRLQ